MKIWILAKANWMKRIWNTEANEETHVIHAESDDLRFIEGGVHIPDFISVVDVEGDQEELARGEDADNGGRDDAEGSFI
jgi:hypothetical protein